MLEHRSIPGPGLTRAAALKHSFLIDDVYTTGADDDGEFHGMVSKTLMVKKTGSNK